jgi:hypothetical protein
MSVKNWFSSGLAAASLICVLVFMGQCTGRTIAESSIDRLQLLWPNFSDLSDRDRAMLFALSLQCGLHDRPMEQGQVADCLTSALRDPTIRVPPDETIVSVTWRMNELFAVASLPTAKQFR